ncbi:U6 snRNA phosphodiesterase 1 [Palaemon carinicauda]|uniref:U6 snRNA phosphodiesterase 1 n=1 Tax=Palaemon carinicauda TaxID=392227 RepID=UPI0035B5BCAE
MFVTMATGRQKQGALSLLQSYGTDSDDDDSGYTSEDEKKRKQEFHNPHERVKKRRKSYDDDEEEMAVDQLPPRRQVPSEGGAMGSHLMRDYQEEERLPHHQRQSTMDTTSHTGTSACAIPLPPELCFPKGAHVDDPSDHEGRIRSFPHEKGNWASILYVPLQLGVYGPSFASFLASLIATCQQNDVKLTPSTQLHISLTRTLVLQLHWIQPLADDLRVRLGRFPKFSLWLHGLNVYVNEEKTRTFLGLRVCHGRNELQDIVSEVDLCIEEFRLPPFYKDGSFHASVAWCTGDVSEDLRRLLPVLENLCSQYFAVETEMRTFNVHTLNFKTGNRLHNIHLKNSD